MDGRPRKGWNVHEPVLDAPTPSFPAFVRLDVIDGRGVGYVELTAVHSAEAAAGRLIAAETH